MPGPSLEQLFCAFLATGDEAALLLLMRRSAPALRRLARRLGASADDAEDLVQETIVAAIQGADRFDPTRPLLPWLKGILAFRAAKVARDDVRRRRLWSEAAESVPPRTTAPPESHASEHELRASLHDAIASLPTDYRSPLQEYLIAGRSPLEIARGLGIGRATVRVRLHRGLLRLRQSLVRWVTLLVAVLLGRRAPASGTAAPRSRAPFAAVLGGAIAVLAVSTVWTANAGVATPAAAAPSGEPRSGTPSDSRGGATTPFANERTAVRGDTTGRLAVRVVDAAGRGVPHVGLVLEPRSGVDPVLHRRRAVTGIGGEAAWEPLEPDEYRVVADRGAEDVVDVRAGANDVVLTASSGSVVRGRVVDGDGVAVTGATVWLSDDSSGPWRGNDVVTTDSAGRFELQHVPDGAFVAVRHAEFVGSGAVRFAASARIGEVELVLGPRGGAVDVVVLDPCGAPCADALVFVGESMDIAPFVLADGAAPWRLPPVERRTGVDGTMRCGALAPGRHPLFVRAAGRAPYTGSVEVVPGGRARHVAHLQRSGGVTGRVVDAKGTPVADAQVVFRGDDMASGIDVRSSPGGAFRFECVPSGQGQVAARAGGMVPFVRALDVVAGEHAAMEIVLRASRTLRGALLCDDPAAVRGATVRATWPRSALCAWQAAFEVAADGTFALAAEADGTPSLELRVAGEPMWRAVDAFTSWNEDAVHVRLPATFAADAWLVGSASSDDGAPIAGARVFVHRDGVQWAEVGRTAADGSFRVGPLAAATYGLFFESTAPSVPTAWTNGIELPRGSTREVRFEAPPTGAVDIEFVRSDGAPVGELAITLVGTAPERRAVLAQTARLRQRLVAGDYRLFVMGEHVQWLEAMPIRVTAGTTTERRVELAPGRRCTLAVRGLPRPPGDEPAALRVRDCTRRERSVTFTLLHDAPDRLAAVLATGDYVLECEDRHGVTWQGAFAVDVAASGGWSIPVRMAPLAR
ncbi:MAG: sigma-70 family RNA polymerase sigma factor [Planctomycetes bacterium]|nr:sigma-70 family RNA polymerase sigma factor [Planctomycetota bacterium]